MLLLTSDITLLRCLTDNLFINFRDIDNLKLFRFILNFLFNIVAANDGYDDNHCLFLLLKYITLLHCTRTISPCYSEGWTRNDPEPTLRETCTMAIRLRPIRDLDLGNMAQPIREQHFGAIYVYRPFFYQVLVVNKKFYGKPFKFSVFLIINKIIKNRNPWNTCTYYKYSILYE